MDSQQRENSGKTKEVMRLGYEELPGGHIETKKTSRLGRPGGHVEASLNPAQTGGQSSPNLHGRVKSVLESRAREKGGPLTGEDSFYRIND